jgi:hypothetical protein
MPSPYMPQTLGELWDLEPTAQVLAEDLLAVEEAASATVRAVLELAYDAPSMSAAAVRKAIARIAAANEYGPLEPA